MAETIDELLVKLGLDVEAGGFKEANNQFIGLRSTAIQAGAAIGVALVGVGVGLAKMSGDIAKSRNDFAGWATAFGVSAQWADKVRHAMNAIGGSDAEAKGLIENVDNLREMAKWGELATKAFTAQGFSPADIQSMNTPDATDFLSRGISGIKDPDLRRRVLNALGFSSPNQQNLMSNHAGFSADMAKAEQLGVISDEMIKASAAYIKASAEAQTQLANLKDMIAVQLLPKMTEWMEALTGWVGEHKDGISDAIEVAQNPAASFLLASARDSSVEQEGFLDKLWSGLKDANKPGMGMEFGLLRKLFGLPASPETSGPAPARPSGPLSNDAIFNALIQQESGGRHYGDGSLLRSSAGARGITQVMPATGRNPGYGVSPLANDSKEEYLRFGREYLAAMMKEFDGDTQKALAAYNAGPGAVKNAVSSHGANWMSAMPGETQAYVPSIMERASKSGVNNYYSIDARGATDPAAVENAARKVFRSELSNAVQVSRDGIPNNVQ